MTRLITRRVHGGFMARLLERRAAQDRMEVHEREATEEEQDEKEEEEKEMEV